MKIKMLFVLLLVLIVCSCRESSIIIEPKVKKEKIVTGLVWDKYFDKPIKSARISFNEGIEYTYSNGDGNFIFDNLILDQYKFYCENEYYYPDSINVNLSNVDSAKIIFELDRKLIGLYGIKLKIYETYPHYYKSDFPKLVLYLETEDFYNCSNYWISNKSNINGQIITVEIDTVILPGGMCFTSIGPATALIQLDNNPNKYLLKIQQEDLTDEYFLTVSEEAVQLEIVDTLLTDIEYDTYWRYPKNSFVYLCGTMNDNKWIYEDFLDTLHKYVQVAEFKFPDSVVICYPTSTSGYYNDMPAKYFKYENEIDFLKIDTILMNYTRKQLSNQSGVGVSVVNWKNQSFYSWSY